MPTVKRHSCAHPGSNPCDHVFYAFANPTKEKIYLSFTKLDYWSKVRIAVTAPHDPARHRTTRQRYELQTHLSWGDRMPTKAHYEVYTHWRTYPPVYCHTHTRNDLSCCKNIRDSIAATNKNCLAQDENRHHRELHQRRGRRVDHSRAYGKG
jgi:hypothetical protein